MGSVSPVVDTGSKDAIFARDEIFWSNYLKGRPRAPDSFFERIFQYHHDHNGRFVTVHDVGAGNGPYAHRLRSKFQHVIVSDIVPENVQLAQDRLGSEGFSYRAAKIEESDDIPAGSVDMVFATNVLHFPDQNEALEAIARQLKPGGTFVGAGFGPATFDDDAVQDVWSRICHQGGRILLAKADDPEQTIAVMRRSQGLYNVAPLDDKLFIHGARRIHLNVEKGGLTGLLPPEYSNSPLEPNYTGPNDVVTFEREKGWSFEADLKWIKEHFGSFPFSVIEPLAFNTLWAELEELLKDGRFVAGRFPAKVILATRR